MLKRLHVKNFKLLRDVQLEFKPGSPTVLIGPNSSGKSTVIEVLDFLARCADSGLEGALKAHGGFLSIRTAGVSSPLEISSKWGFVVKEKSWELEWTFRLDSSRSSVVTVVYESLTNRKEQLVATDDEGDRTILDETDNDIRVDVENPRKLSFELFKDATRYSGLGWIRNIVSKTRVLGSMASAPAWSRAGDERASARDSMIISTQSFIGREGLGLANALYNIQTDHHKSWATLEATFRAEFPFVQRIIFPADPGGSRISFAVEDSRFPGQRIYASEMSDGMIVFLCLLSLVLHPEQRAVLALDEPDAHLHPSAVRRLLALAHEPGFHRDLIFVTHANAVLDELRNPAESVRIFEPSTDGAKVRRLDKDALSEWRREYTLSEMRQTGLLDPSNTDYSEEK